MMKLLQQGDPCPCCGQPIKTDDPDVLQLLTAISERRCLPRTLAEIKDFLETK